MALNATTMMMSQQQPPQPQVEQAASHTMILDRANTKSTRLMRHATILRSMDQNTTRSLPRQHSRFHANATLSRPVHAAQVQLTTAALPNSPQLADKYALPVGVSVRPLAPTPSANSQDRRPPLVHFQDIDPSITVVRCGQCRSYINPFAHFTAADRYICAVCRRPNVVPTKYQSELVPSQAGVGGALQRADLSSRPELTHATVDFIAPSDYVPNAPKRPTFLFLIDVSYQAVASGMLKRTCEGIALGLDKLVKQGAEIDDEEEPGDYQVAFVAYDTNVYLFQFGDDAIEAGGNEGENETTTLDRDTPLMIAAPDLVSDALEMNDKGEMQGPLELPCLVDDLLCSPSDPKSLRLINNLLKRLPTMFQHSAAAETVFGPALNTAMSLLFEPGGKVFAFVASCPASGEGKLEAARTGAVGGDSSSTQPANDFYKCRAIACSARQISVDLFVAGGLGGPDVDLASLAPIARYTSGHITRITPHTLSGLARDIEYAVGEREYGFDAVLRLRTPTHVTLKNFYGHFYVRGPDLLALPICDSDSVYSFEIAPTMTIPNNHAAVFMQIALMYTNRARERRLRVMTFGIEVATDLSKVYNRASAPVTASFLAKGLVDACIASPFNKAIQNALVDKVGASLKTFRGILFGMSRTTNQLSLPASLASLPLYITGIVRAAAASRPPAAFPDTRADERVASGALLVFSASIECFMSCVLPVCFCIWDPVIGSPSELPRPELCSVESFKADSIYFVDAGAAMSPFIWVGRSVPQAVLSAFGFYSLPRKIAADPDQVHIALQQVPPSVPEARAAAESAAELYRNRQTLVAENMCWGESVTAVNQEAAFVLGSCWEGGAHFAGSGAIVNAYEKVMHPFLVEDESSHEGAFPYGAVLLALRKASETT